MNHANNDSNLEPDKESLTLPGTAKTLDIGAVAQRTTITVDQVASLLGIGRTAAYETARRGQLPTRRLGRRLLVPVPALLEWLGAPPTPPCSASPALTQPSPG